MSPTHRRAVARDEDVFSETTTAIDVLRRVWTDLMAVGLTHDIIHV
jgi:hypothetical protein